jgi:GNAT superfamily N-acetyltransferase
MDRFREMARLSDGREAVIREPDPVVDVDPLVGFFAGLPAEIRQYLRYNVSERETAARRLKQVDGKDHWRLVAEVDGKIVGDLTMDREPYTWTRHVAEMRCVVRPEFRHTGIEPILLDAVIRLGRQGGVERICTEVLAVQKDWIEILEGEGFVYEVTRKKYAKDTRGKLHDVVMLSNDLESLWKNLAEQFEEMDIKLSRFYEIS